MKILILGAGGQIPTILIPLLTQKPDASLVLYARNATNRLCAADPDRTVLINGDFKDMEKLVNAMQTVDIVYVNDMRDGQATSTIIAAMNKARVKRIIAASVLGICDEIPGEFFGQWSQRMTSNRRRCQAESARLLEESDLDYTLLRLAWLYNQEGNTRYMLTNKGEPFVGTQVTRQATAQLIVDMINDQNGRFIRASLGVSEPDTDWGKPSFYQFAPGYGYA